MVNCLNEIFHWIYKKKDKCTRLEPLKPTQPLKYLIFSLILDPIRILKE